ncbi:MAG: glycoside hydrolase [Bacteroidales bacterium]|nr:glycoside hydrolase [Bacteroidales bacterium]
MRIDLPDFSTLAFIVLINSGGSLLLNAQGPGKGPGSGSYLSVPVFDLDKDMFRQVVVDREEGQYLGHPTTALMDDGETILAVYPKGHGRGEIVYKRSADGGKSWSERLPVPSSWKTSKEVPTLFRTTDASGKKRLIMFSGLYPARLSHSEDDGNTWSELENAGDWGGIVVMGAVSEIIPGPGKYMALFHDDLRFFTENGAEFYKADQAANKQRLFTLYKTFSVDGGLTWSYPEPVLSRRDMNLCEPGIIRSPAFFHRMRALHGALPSLSRMSLTATGTCSGTRPTEGYLSFSAISAP